MHSFLEKILPVYILGFGQAASIDAAIEFARTQTNPRFLPNDKNGLYFAHVVAPASASPLIAAERPYATGQCSDGTIIALWRLPPDLRDANEANHERISRINQALLQRCGGMPGTFNPDRTLPLPVRSLFVPISHPAAPVVVAAAAEAVELPETPETAEAPEPLTTAADTLLALPPHGCRWPLASGAWCGRPCGSHKSYCPDHARIAAQPPRSRADREKTHAYIARCFARKEKSAC